MSKLDQLQRLHRLFASRRLPLSIHTIAEELECSEKTARRAIDNLRDYYNAPIEYFPEHRGWAYTHKTDQIELPGLWLTAEELQALTSLLHLIGNLSEGLLRKEFRVIETQVDRMLSARGLDKAELDRHIKILPIGHRGQTGSTFNRVAEALIRKKQLEIRYTSYRGETSQRIVSPETLVHYRENWYLDAWCHLREGLRTFSLARMEQIEPLKTNARKIPQSQLDQHFSESYGIFAGTPKHTARLRFLPSIAREIAQQHWHPQQQSEWDGKDFLLSFPYSDERELVQDLLRHTPHVYVEAPVKLRKALQSRLQRGLELQIGKGLGWL